MIFDDKAKKVRIFSTLSEWGVVGAAAAYVIFVRLASEKESEFQSGLRTAVQQTIVGVDGKTDLGLGVTELLQGPIQAYLGAGQYVIVNEIVVMNLVERRRRLRGGGKNRQVELDTGKEIQMIEFAAQEQRRLQINGSVGVTGRVKTLLRSIGLHAELHDKAVVIKLVA